MSTLWTPGDDEPEVEVEDEDEEQVRARQELNRIRDELLSTPVRDIVANHAIGLWQLAVLHLGLDDEEHAPNLEEAKLAIDSLWSLVEGTIDRLGDHAEPLRAALTNIRLAYVRVSEDADT
ncbi:MAG: hypothetical protein HYU28_08275 [Actinobacteria bacterium]|nr:hypothetical protein [Actinomycetota bacterium]